MLQSLPCRSGLKPVEVHRRTSQEENQFVSRFFSPPSLSCRPNPRRFRHGEPPASKHAGMLLGIPAIPRFRPVYPGVERLLPKRRNSPIFSVEWKRQFAFLHFLGFLCSNVSVVEVKRFSRTAKTLLFGFGHITRPRRISCQARFFLPVAAPWFRLVPKPAALPRNERRRSGSLDQVSRFNQRDSSGGAIVPHCPPRRAQIPCRQPSALRASASGSGVDRGVTVYTVVCLIRSPTFIVVKGPRVSSSTYFKGSGLV